jgi:hypothetical protein
MQKEKEKRKKRQDIFFLAIVFFGRLFLIHYCSWSVFPFGCLYCG